MSGMVERRDATRDVIEGPDGCLFEVVEGADGAITVRVVAKDGEDVAGAEKSAELTDRQSLALALDALVAQGRLTAAQAVAHIAALQDGETIKQAEKSGVADGAVEKAAERRPSIEEYCKAVLRQTRKGWR